MSTVQTVQLLQTVRRHVYPAFNGWQKQEGRKPFLLHCRARAQWQIARTRPPIEAGGPERYWENFQAPFGDELRTSTEVFSPFFHHFFQLEIGWNWNPKWQSDECFCWEIRWDKCIRSVLEDYELWHWEIVAWQAMLEDEHPDWLDPVTRFPLSSMEPLEEYEEDCENAPEEIQKEIDENRRAWANCKDSTELDPVYCICCICCTACLLSFVGNSVCRHSVGCLVGALHLHGRWSRYPLAGKVQERRRERWESKEGNMNSVGELPFIIFIIWIRLGQIHG